jgi:elongation factor 3
MVRRRSVEGTQLFMLHIPASALSIVILDYVRLPYIVPYRLTREQLTAMGFQKNVDAIDAREAAAAGAHTKPLTAAVIAKHLAEVGLEQEFTLHHRMRGLSGGQKVKVVLGAAMWQNPHILVLDEPSNYLDRDSLGALAGAISDFGGGVVIISHNREVRA